MSFRRIKSRVVGGCMGALMRVSRRTERYPPQLRFTLGSDLVESLGWEAKQRVGLWIGSQKDRGLIILRLVNDRDGMLLYPKAHGCLTAKISVSVVGVQTEDAPLTKVEATPGPVTERGVADGAVKGSRELVLCRPKWWGGAGEPSNV